MKKFKFTPPETKDCDNNFVGGIRKFLSSSIQKMPPLISGEDIEKIVASIHRVSYSELIHRLINTRDTESRQAQEYLDEASVLERKYMDGAIPEFLTNDASWRLPSNVWVACAVILLFLIAFGGTGSEAVNFAWNIRFLTQSLPMALLYCLPILLFPVAEAAILRTSLVTPTIRRLILISQVIVALGAGMVYVALTLRGSDVSLASAFSPHSSSFSPSTIRMAAQLVTSLCLGAICLHAAIELGVKATPRNPEFAAAQKRVKTLRKQADECFATIAAVTGLLAKIEERKTQEILRCKKRFQQFEAEFRRYQSALEKIIIEKSDFELGLPVVLLTAVGVSLFTGCSPDQPKVVPQNKSLQVAVVVSPFLTNREATMADLAANLTHLAGDNIHVLDGWTGDEVASFKVPSLTYFTESAVAQQVGAPFQNLIAWTQTEPGNKKLKGTGALAIATVLQRINEICPSPDNLLVIGSPIYKSLSDTNADFFNGHYRVPSFGHFRTTNSPFTSIGVEKSLFGTHVHFLFPNEQMNWSAQYESRLRKFYSGFFSSRGGVLVTFSPLLNTGFADLDSGTNRPVELVDLTADTSPAEMIDENESRPTNPTPIFARVVLPTTNKNASAAKMSTEPSLVLKSERAVTTDTKPATSNAVVSIPANSNVQSRAISPVIFRQTYPGTFIEIRYPLGTADAALHVRPYPGAEELSATECATPDGWYYQAYDQAQMEQVKWVYLPAGCDPRQAVVWINYSSGFGRLGGSLRWITPEGETTIPFLFPSFEGGDSRRTHEWRRGGSLHWLRINLLYVTDSHYRVLSSY